uniref:Uncharacterized protein n=1 Tax=Romanomermis culicivorax TaxID=13658 RepID=A0A915KZ04_ROMCU
MDLVKLKITNQCTFLRRFSANYRGDFLTGREKFTTDDAAYGYDFFTAAVQFAAFDHKTVFFKSDIQIEDSIVIFRITIGRFVNRIA